MATPPPPSRRRSSLLRFISIAILVLIILLGLAVLITWLVLRPKGLIYTVENASIHNFNLTDANHLYANFDVTIRSYNPNHRVSFYYDSVEISVRYKDQTLATNGVHPFFQPHKNVTRLEARLTSQTVALYGSMPSDLRHEKRSGDIELDVLMKARIRFKVGLWKSEDRTMRILCSPVLVHFYESKGFKRAYCDVELWKSTNKFGLALCCDQGNMAAGIFLHLMVMIEFIYKSNFNCSVYKYWWVTKFSWFRCSCCFLFFPLVCLCLDIDAMYSLNRCPCLFYFLFYCNFLFMFSLVFFLLGMWAWAICVHTTKILCILLPQCD